jgi:hypothetical protein
MNKSQPYFAQKLTHPEAQQWIDDPEDAIHAQVSDQIDGDHATWGVLNGYEVVQNPAGADLNVQIANGTAYDEDGQRIPHTSGPYLFNLSATVPGSNSRYVRVYAEYLQVTSDPRVDGDSNPLSYRLTEDVKFAYDLGTPAASPTKPAILANKVLLATILIASGATQIFDSDISMELETDYLNPGEMDRQEGGVVFPHGRLATRPAYFKTLASPKICLDTGFNHIRMSGGDIIMGTGATPWNTGGRIFMERGRIYNCREIYVDGPPQDAGYRYIDGTPSDEFGDALEVPKPWDIPGESFMPAKQSTDPWSAGATTDNVWQHENFGSRIIWTMYWGGAAHGSSRTGVYLRAPITVPERCRLVEVKLHINVINTFTGFADLDFVCGVAYQPKSSTLITVHTTKTYNAASGGIWTATGRGEIDLMTTGDSALTIRNDLNSYFIYCYHDDASGVGAARFVDIFHGTANTVIREASHVY